MLPTVLLRPRTWNIRKRAGSEWRFPTLRFIYSTGTWNRRRRELPEKFMSEGPAWRVGISGGRNSPRSALCPARSPQGPGSGCIKQETLEDIERLEIWSTSAGSISRLKFAGSELNWVRLRACFGGTRKCGIVVQPCTKGNSAEAA